MSLLPIRNLPKLLLRNPGHKSLHTPKNLRHTVRIHRLPIRLPYQRLNLRQTISNQMAPQPIIDLFKHQRPKFLVFASLAIEDLVHESYLKEFLGSYALAHDKRFVGFGYAETLHEGAGREALGYETE